MRNADVGNWIGYELSGSTAIETGYSGMRRDLAWRTALPGPAASDTTGALSKTPDGRIVLTLAVDDTNVANPFDLNERTLLFSPDGMGGYTSEVRARAWEDAAGEPFRDGDEVELPFAFEFAGQTWEAFHVRPPRRAVVRWEIHRSVP